MTIINNFKNVSGLGVNADKTELMPLGSSKNADILDLGYKIVEELKITGITFTYNHENLTKRNYTENVNNIELTLNIWKQRQLSILGKVQIIKTVGISKLLFVCNMTIVPDKIIKEAKSIFFKFLWNGPNKIKELSTVGDIQQGGMKMPHLESIIESLRVVWVKRYESDNYHPWKEFLVEGLKPTGSHNIINRKIPKNVLENCELSQFNKELITAWNKLQKLPEKNRRHSRPNLMEQRIYNKAKQ